MLEVQNQRDVSVAMCTYNGERYLQEQLTSIAAQTRLPRELVVCDDRSTDETVAILQAFGKRAPFPVHIHENERQLRSTRNFDKAMRLCKGSYIALSDQDDRWSTQKLERMGAVLDGDEAVGMVFSDARLIDSLSHPTGSTLWASLRFGKEAQRIFREEPERILLERPVVTGATMLFRASLLDRFSRTPQSWVHDGWLTWMSVLWHKPFALEQPLTDYRIHSAQQLGVGKTTFRARMHEIRGRQRKQYASVAKEFEDLLAYVEAADLSTPETFVSNLRETIFFLRARGAAPLFAPARFLFLLQNVRYYRSLSTPGWRSFFRDLLLGGPKIL